MDEHNVHHLWGLSPGIDLGAVATRQTSSVGLHDELRLLQVASYDPRHTLTTLCRATRHLDRHQGPVHLYIHEEEPEVLARHLLLLSVLLDGSLPPKERMHTLLELHGNVLLREKTADYLDTRARTLESLLVALAAGSDASSLDVQQLGADMACLASLLDLSLLKFQERDALVEAVHKCRKQVEYDMVKAWDARKRKFYGDRYDFQKNMVDWDYHMRLLVAGTPGQDPVHGSIVHFHHFRHWRLHGVAYELRDSAYSHPNRSLLSTAVGRTKEFKDRNLKDVGRSVVAWGYWGDLLNSPYHAFGSTCEEPSFFAISNKQYSRTAVDIAEHNVLALLHELRCGERYVLPSGAEAHRAKVARGPTSMQDLEQEAGKEQQEEAGKQQQEEAGKQQQGEQQQGEQQQHVATGQQDDPQEGQRHERQQAGRASSSCQEDQRQAERQPHSAPTCGPGPEPGANDGQAPFLPSDAFQGARVGYVFRKGVTGTGYYVDNSLSTESLHHQRRQQQEAGGSCLEAAGAALGSCNGSHSKDSDHQAPAASTPAAAASNKSPAQLAEEQRLQQQEAELDAAAYARLSQRFKLTLVSGDLVKNLSGKAKLQGAFDAITLGHRHLHLAGPQYQLDRLARADGGVLVVESARYLLQLNKEQAAAFRDKIVEIAGGAGWVQTADAQVNAAVTDVHVAFARR